MTNRSALVAVIVALLVGLIGSLAVRPPGQAAPAAVHAEGELPARIKWRVPVVFQTTLPVLGDNPVYVADIIRRASNGAVQLDLFEPGEIVPAFSVTDAVRDRKVEAGYVWLGYDQGKIPASPLVSAVPFGMEPWEYSAWWYEAGGRELTEKLYAPHNIHPIYCGMTGPETAGWFRTKIESLDDIAGLKIRFAGLGGKVIERLGASVTMIPGGEIFQALEKGAIDASEFALPVVDQTLGFNRVAKFNYYPGWHQPFTASHMVVNIEAWNASQPGRPGHARDGLHRGRDPQPRKLASAQQGAVIAGFPSIGVSAEISARAHLARARGRQPRGHRRGGREGRGLRGDPRARSARSGKNYAHWKSRAYLPRDF